MRPEEMELRLSYLDEQLETGGISLGDFLQGLYDLIGGVLRTGDDDLISGLAIHLQPTKPWEASR
jgi:hypothetical protein